VCRTTKYSQHHQFPQVTLNLCIHLLINIHIFSASGSDNLLIHPKERAPLISRSEEIGFCVGGTNWTVTDTQECSNFSQDTQTVRTYIRAAKSSICGAIFRIQEVYC